MVKAAFEHEGNTGLLSVVTHFGVSYTVNCIKETDQSFRLGGTAINDVAHYEGLILTKQLNFPNDYGKLSKSVGLFNVAFKAFKDEQTSFLGDAILSDESWTDDDRHCYLTEYYGLYVEGNKPSWIASKKPIKDANYLFINLDVLDGGGNVIRRYRASPFIAQYRIMEMNDA